MRILLTISAIVILTGVLLQCKVQQKVEYDIPPYVTPNNKVLLLEKCEKGRVLYQLHCADCHGIFTKGKDSIPNFTKIQIDSYHAAALVGIDPKNHAIARKMSADQIDQVITFLRLRKIPK